MHKIACLIDTESTRTLFELNFRLHLGLRAISCLNVHDLESTVAHDLPEVILINSQNVTTAQIELLLNDAKGARPLLISIGPETLSSMASLHLQSAGEWPQLIKFLKKLWPDTQEKLKDEKYVAIALFYFFGLTHSPYDVYSQQTVGGNLSFKKEFIAFEDLDHKRLQNLKAQGVETLYVRSKNRVEFLSYVNSELLKRIHTDSHRKDQISIGNTYELVKGLIQHIGLTPEIVTVCESVVKELEEKLSADSELKGYLEKLKSEEGLSFSYRLGQLALLLSVAVVPLSPEVSLGPETMAKLTYTSFLRDIPIEVDHWERIRSADDLEKASEISSSEKMKIYYHAKEAARLAEKIPGIPREALQMIREHHGSKLGEGFSDKIKDDLLPLSRIYILMEDLAFKILNDQKTTSNVEDKIDQLLKSYTYSWAQELLIALKKLVK